MPEIIKIKKMPVFQPYVYGNKQRKIETKIQRFYSKDIIGKKTFTRDDVMKITKSQLTVLKKAYAKMGLSVRAQIVLFFDGKEGSEAKRSMRSGKFFSEPDEANMWNEDDYEILHVNDPTKYHRFDILYEIKPTAGGADDEKNDCLFNCFEFFKVDVGLTAMKIKNYLGLKRCDPIDITRIKDIENHSAMSKYKINVYGDSEYISKKKASETLNILLHNGHYQPDYQKTNTMPLQIFRGRKRFVVFDDLNNCYDGETKGTITKKEKAELKNTHTETDYVLIQKPFYITKAMKKNNINNMYDYHKYLTEKNNILKKETEGKLNLLQTGSFSNSALMLYDQNSRTIRSVMKNISLYEGSWIDKGTSGAVVFAKQYEGEAWKYDYNSYYLSIMASPNFSIPVEEGETKTLDELPTIIQYGLYRVVIEKKDGIYFKYNKNAPVYTHYELNYARELGLKIEMIKDDAFNAYIYTKRIKGSQLFKTTVDFLFEMKQKKVPLIKDIAGTLWGALVEKNKTTRIVKQDDYYDVPDDVDVLYQKDLNEDGVQLTLTTIKRPFLHNEARMKCFLLAKARVDVCKFISKHVGFENIVRIHTDGFVSKVKIDESLLGLGLGEIGYEGHCEHYKIHNVMKREGDFLGGWKL